jgi:hypothetical protein
VDAPELGIQIATALRKFYPQQYKLERINTLLANRHTLEMLQAGTDPARIVDDWREAIASFEVKRKAALLY